MWPAGAWQLLGMYSLLFDPNVTPMALMWPLWPSMTLLWLLWSLIKFIPFFSCKSVQRVLDQFVTEGKVKEKVYGKQKVFEHDKDECLSMALGIHNRPVCVSCGRGGWHQEDGSRNYQTSGAASVVWERMQYLRFKYGFMYMYVCMYVCWYSGATTCINNTTYAL